MQLHERIRSQAAQQDVRLLGQIEISDEEYYNLLGYVKRKIPRIYLRALASHDAVLAVALVQIAIRVYQDGNYWTYFQEEIDMEVSSPILSYLGQIFIATLRQYHLFEIKREPGERYAYVENIKAHAFVPDNYMEGYFDFLFSFYDRNLFRQLTEHLDEEIYDMVEFMSDAIALNKDSVSVGEDENKPAKSYRLLKATQKAIAQCTPSMIISLIGNHLRMIDTAFFDEHEPDQKNRFARAFVAWSHQKTSELRGARATGERKKGSVFYRKPRFEIDRGAQIAFLILPEQKIRTSVYNGKAYARIRCGDMDERYRLSMYRAYGVLISEPLRVKIPHLFAACQVDIISGSTRSFVIPAKPYRLFNENFDETNKLAVGQNYILASKSSKVESNARFLYINSDDTGWNEYSISISDEKAVVYIDGHPLTISGEYTTEPFFEHEEKTYQVFDSQSASLMVTSAHPVLPFTVARESLPGTRVLCNDSVIKHTLNLWSVVELENAPDQLGVNLRLNDILGQEEGAYSIWIDEPGKNKKLACQYLLIHNLRCLSDSARYVFQTEALISIEGDYNVSPINCEQVKDGVYRLDFASNSECAEFTLSLKGNQYLLRVPVSVFKHGFMEPLTYEKWDYVWHKTLTNRLYIQIPRAEAAKVYLNKESHEPVVGQATTSNTFMFDIHSFIDAIRESNFVFNYINLQYFDGAWKNLSLYRVLNRLYVRKITMLNTDGQCSLHVSYMGDSLLRIVLYDYLTNQEVLNEIFMNGIHLLEECDIDQFFKLRMFEFEQDVYGFSDSNVSIGTIKRIAAINLNDISNCGLVIEELKFEGVKLPLKFRYQIKNLYKENETYYHGELFAKVKQAGKFEAAPAVEFLQCKVRLEVLFDEENLMLLSVQTTDGEFWSDLCYDKQDRRLRDLNDEIHNTSRDYERFVIMHNDASDYEVSLRRLY